MDAKPFSLKDIFDAQCRYMVPLYQRPYVWTEQDKWDPLWYPPKTAFRASKKAVAERVKEKPASKSVTESQPMLSDFGLYKCSVCGKMVMGYEKDRYAEEKHRSQVVEW